MKTLPVILLILFHANLIAQELTYNPDFSDRPENSYSGSSRSFVFSVNNQVFDMDEELGKIDSENVRRHALGDVVAKRLYLFEKTYTYVSEAVPGSFSGKLVIQKPAIYSSIMKLDKYFTRLEKKGTMSQEEAVKSYSHFLEVALKLYYANTAEFEEELKRASDDKALANLFRRVELI
ncbi:MAG: hypothetical protein R6X09_09050 [Bacteroidales bacterium]